MSAQTVTAAPVLSTDVLDLIKEGADPSIGTMLAGLVVPTLVTAATGAFTVEVLQSSASNMAAPDVIATAIFPLAKIVVDEFLAVPIPQGSISKRYIALRVTPAVALDSVAFSGYIVPEKEVPVNKFFAKVYETI